MFRTLQLLRVAQPSKDYAHALPTGSLLVIYHHRAALGHDQDISAQRGCHVFCAVPNLEPISPVSSRSIAFDVAILEDPY